MGYLYPVPFTHSTSWGAHTRRRPPSTEPGIDMFCAIGTPVLAAADGRVVDVGDSIQPATGRFVTIDLDDGRRVRYLHLSRRTVKVGDRVKRGDVVGYSGATGYGEEDWSWNVAETGGAHVHMTLWPTQRYVFGSAGTLDPQLYFDAATAAATTSKPFEEDSMTAADADRVIAEMTKLVNDQFANFLLVPGARYGYPQQIAQDTEDIRNRIRGPQNVPWDYIQRMSSILEGFANASTPGSVDVPKLLAEVEDRLRATFQQQFEEFGVALRAEILAGLGPVDVTADVETAIDNALSKLRITVQSAGS